MRRIPAGILRFFCAHAYWATLHGLAKVLLEIMMGPGSPETSLNDLLMQASVAARRGDLVSARIIAERGLNSATFDRSPFHAFLGMVSARLGDYKKAAAHLANAHKLRPDDVTIACNLIVVLMDAGRDNEALDVATDRLALADASRRIARYRGFLSQKLEKYDEAVKAYSIVLTSAPADFECLNNIGNAKAGLGDHAGAVQALERAAAINPHAAPTRLNLAAALIALERYIDGEKVLVKASEDFPDDFRPPYQLYVLCKSLQKQKEALIAIEMATDRDPNVANMQLKLAIEYGAERRTAEAERAFRRAIELNPLETDAYLGLAIQYEHTNREDDFAPLIEQARRNGVGDGAIAFIETLELRRLKKFEEALMRLSDVPCDIEPIRTVHVRATLLDRLLRTDEAFAAFGEANRMMSDGPSDPLARSAQLRSELKSDIELLTPDWVASWRPVEIDDEFADPVFLVGFPRSGTTLLDTILMGHPDAVVMEEQPPLNFVEMELGGSAALANLDDAGVARARRRYFEEVKKILPLSVGKLLIDKSPLFLYRAPLIHRLFPRARIILSLRHPCDVVLSCFMSNFRLNSAMANFLRLEDAAAFYDLCFTHWRRSCALFPLNIHTVAYENLVEDVGVVVSPLLDFLGLDANSEMLDHQKTARARGLITTASYSQVAEPLYKRASGRWRRYSHHLAPIFNTLAPWAIAHAYGDFR